ncbi:MAG: metal-dependent hydrolase [Solirubrobacteraceae bacterium]
MTSQTHVAGGALFTAAGLGAANAAGWMHTPVWALAVGIAWGAIAGELPDIDHPKARVSRTGVASGGVVLVALAWVVGKLAAVSHTGAHLNAQSAVRFLLAHLAVVYPYAVAATALGYLSHLVLDSLTGPIPWGWPCAHRRVALAPAALRIRTGSSIETWLVRPAITIAAILMFLEVVGIPSHPR